jgi:ADP-ribosyl-[dinitrogen reductase] hydrolase
MLLQTAIGDAYGAGFEYAAPEFVGQNNTIACHIKHPKHNLVPGSYTDDTQMALAIAEVIVSGKPFTREVLADAFVQAFKRDQREGYARGFYAFLCEVKDGAEFLARMKPYSDKSGAAMRAVVVGIFPTIEEVIAKATLQAKITHDTEGGINSAVAAALTGHYFFYDLGPKAELGKFLDKHVAGDWAQPYSGAVGEKGWMCTKAAVTAIVNSASMSELLKASIAFTGDVDTVAAIALGAGCASKEIAQDIPQVLEDTLENGTYGRDYLRQIDAKIADQLAAFQSTR